MKFLADESLDRQIVDRLRQDDHVVLYVAEMDPGIDDEIVLDIANREAAVLLTADKDFGELVFRRCQLPQGVVLVRLAGLLAATKAPVVASAISEHGAELPRAFTVISPGAIRIRPQTA